MVPLEIKIQKVFDNEIVEIIIIMASSLENQLLNNNVILYEYSNTGKTTYDQFDEIRQTKIITIPDATNNTRYIIHLIWDFCQLAHKNLTIIIQWKLLNMIAEIVIYLMRSNCSR